TRVKICGITNPQDAHAAVSLGVDALGLVFYPPSPRAVSIEQAEAVVRDLPPFVTVVGLFLNEDRETIGEILSRVHLDLLQFHGDESPDECIGHGRPHIKAIRMRDGVDLYAERERYSAAAGLLLDTYRKDTPGGTGEAFNWGAIPAELAGSIILAGGLAPDNIEQAIKLVRPYAVDVSGGVEREKGIKDREKISAFMRGVECANR
ncbi:MAG: phosphoribosylanthranilate isomerase, partial [Gammaproteobacteria bacterium]|nr:phosphoribosylanthranilate isomerase [Gammaproteobacteria bacterium]